MRKLFLILVYLSPASLFAEEPRELKLAEMLRATSITHFNTKLKELNRFESFQSECDIQLKFNMLPSSCFEVIEFERRHRILSEKNYLKAKMWLSENCIEQANQIVEVKESTLNLKPLPEACRRIANDKLNDQQYRDVLANPSLLFKKRL